MYQFSCNNFSYCIFPQIDLDTIDVSNLNRQFLFQKRHVGKSKAQVCLTVLMISVERNLLDLFKIYV